MTTPRNSPQVVHRELPHGVIGYFSKKHNMIYIAPGLTQGQYRSTLAHELIHAERQDYASGNEWLDTKQEIVVEQEAALRLIPLPELFEAARWCQSLWELAEHLIVDEEMLEARIAMLTDSQKDRLRRTCEGWWST